MSFLIGCPFIPAFTVYKSAAAGKEEPAAAPEIIFYNNKNPIK